MGRNACLPITFIIALLAAVPFTGLGQAPAETARQKAISNFLAGNFRWLLGPPVLSPVERREDLCFSVKDPSIIRYNGRWHLFCTIRSKKRTHQIEYLSFTDWKDADSVPRHILKLTNGYFCAPEVFFFRPQGKWYLIYQVIERSRKPALQPAFSTSDDVGNPESWTKPALLFEKQPANVRHWIDFWVICTDEKAYLFFTSNDGRMWRSETSLGDFPHGWSRPVVALRADIFEASHTYRLKGLNKYLTIVEARARGRRYYKAYIADHLDGRWRPLAASLAKPFAGLANVRQVGPHWTDSFSHGELIREGFDERLTVDPANLRFLFQGVSDREKAGKKYGEIPWRLGLLEPDRGMGG